MFAGYIKLLHNSYILLVIYCFFMARVLLRGFRCERCGHEWIPRNKGELPSVCPKCKSPYWNRPRRKKSNE